MQATQIETRIHALGQKALATLAAVSLVLAAATPAEAQDTDKLRYVQAGPNGARARNLYDAQGLVVRDLKAGTPLAVYGERAGWLDVEAPGGFEVWVYGKYVRPGSTAGKVEITGSNVRMRPQPSSGPESLPLTQKFTAGDEVRLIRRNDPSLALDSDWVQVWSPPGARAWVRQAETVPIGSSTEGSRLWADAVAAVAAAPLPGQGANQGLGSREPEVAAKAAAAPAPQAQDSVRVNDLLRKANQLLTAERAREDQGGQPNYAVVVSAYEEVLTQVSNGPSADLARSRIQLAKSYADAHQIRIDLERQKNEYEGRLAQREVNREVARERDVFEGRFAERGWLERRSAAVQGEDPIWVLHYAGGDAAELLCSSGRYDLALFSDFEIGVNGAVVRGTLTDAVGEPARPRTIDITSIEVIAGRRR